MREPPAPLDNSKEAGARAQDRIKGVDTVGIFRGRKSVLELVSSGRMLPSHTIPHFLHFFGTFLLVRESIRLTHSLTLGRGLLWESWLYQM